MQFNIKTREYAKFRAGLRFSAHRNLATYAHWVHNFHPFLERQFLDSGETDPKQWHQNRFEHDVGLMLA